MRFSCAAGSEIAARFSRFGNSCQSVGRGLAANEQDAFVALRNLRDKPLRHDGACAVMGQRFKNHADIVIGAVHAEHAGTAHAVERFQDDIPVLCEKFANQMRLTGYQRGCNPLRELRDGELFVVIADGARAIDNERTLRLRQFQQIRAVNIFQIERGVLTHQHGVKLIERHG
ncbi:MAG: hypothetical protein FCKEOINB_02326 [Nitrosomonas sp.]|nr:hypothetical protein [Nitrosomonas sp.]